MRINSIELNVPWQDQLEDLYFLFENTLNVYTIDVSYSVILKSPAGIEFAGVIISFSQHISTLRKWLRTIECEFENLNRKVQGLG